MVDTEISYIITSSVRASMGEIAQDNHGIIHVKFDQGVSFTQKEALEFESARNLTFPQEHKYLIIIDLRSNIKPDRSARSEATSDSANRSIRAMAYVVASPLSKILGNLLMGFHKAKYPAKLFTSEEEAIVWLKGFQSQEK